MPGLSVSISAGATPARRPALPFQATLKALRTHLASHDGSTAPHALPLVLAPPLVTTQTGIPGDLPNAFRLVSGSGVFRVQGGKPKPVYTDFMRFPVATRQLSGGNVGDGEDANAWRVSFDVFAPRVAIRLLGNAAPYRIIIDGHYLDLAGTQTATTSGRNFIILDFTSAGGKAARAISLEGEAAQAFDGVHVAASDAVTLSYSDQFHVLVFGDSFSAGAGGYRRNDLFPRRLGDLLGIADVWSSSIGTTGYLAPVDGTIFNLQQRIEADLDRMLSTGSEPDLILFSMGNNDQGQSGSAIAAAVHHCLSVVRSRCPSALLFVCGPWDADAPASSSPNYVAARAAIADAVSGRKAEGIWFLDQDDFAFAKVGYGDVTHPGNGPDGHAALAARLNAQVRAALG